MKNVKCKSCGSKLPSGSDFCPICGAWNPQIPSDMLTEEEHINLESEEFAEVYMQERTPHSDMMQVFEIGNPNQALQLITIPELAKPENARWLALLIDTEGAMGWRVRPERHYGRTYVYRLPYISIGMKEIESKKTVDTAAQLIGVSPWTHIKNQTRIRRFIVDYGRALATLHYIKPYLDKFKRMATLLQILFKHHTHIPRRIFDHAITTLFGKYLTSHQANDILLQMTEEQFNNLVKIAENITEKYLR